MVYRRRNPSGRKTGGKRKFARKVAPRRRVGARNSMVKLVKSIIHRQAENKQSDYAGQQLIGVFGWTGFNTNNIIPCSPYTGWLQISQGVGAYQRVGNKIQTRRLKMRFIINPTGYSGSNPFPKPYDVTIYWVKCKDTPVSLATSSGVLQSFFQNSSSSTPPTGYIFDQIREVNTDQWVVCKKMTLKVGYAIYGGTSTDANKQSFTNNDYKYNQIRTVDLTKWCPKTVQYNDTTNTPATPTLQCLILPSEADGGLAGSTTTALQFTYQLYYEYEDL